jgi:hypothetical protein
MNDGTLTIQFGTSEYSFTNALVSQMSCISSKRNGCALKFINSNTLQMINIFIDQTLSVTITIMNIQNPYNLGLT